MDRYLAQERTELECLDKLRPKLICIQKSKMKNVPGKVLEIFNFRHGSTIRETRQSEVAHEVVGFGHLLLYIDIHVCLQGLDSPNI